MAERQSSDEAPDFGVALALAYATFVARLHRHMTTSGFTGFTTRFGFVLRVLGDESLSLRSLAERLDVSSPAALKLIDAMVAAGYAERVADADDRRVRAIRATPRGREALAEARSFHATAEAEMEAVVGADGVAVVRRGLDAVAAQADELIPASLRRPTVQL